MPTPTTQQTQALALKTSYDEHVRVVTGDHLLSPEGKAESIRQKREQLTEQLRSLEAKHTEAQTARLADLRRRAFRPDGDVVTYRDALSRARAVRDDADALANLYMEATAIGDDQLAQAAAFVASERGDVASGILADWRQSHPDRAAALDELQDLQTPDVSWEGLTLASAFQPPRV